MSTDDAVLLVCLLHGTRYSLLLFGGRVEVQHADSTITVDDWLAFQSPPKVAVLIKLLRRRMDELLRHRIQVLLRSL